MKLTSEQKAIVSEAVSLYEDGGGYVLVNAFAGTGKTTTMISVVDALRSAGAERVLYLAYNRKMADEAKRKLDGKAEARTVHSIAYQKVGEIVGFEKLSKWLNEGKAPHHYFRKDNLWPKVKAYVESDALYPEDDSVFGAIEKMKSDEVRMTHDVYAKAFACALESVDILGIGLDCSDFSDLVYDAIILDEAQDANPQILSIFKSMRGKVKVAVGDTHQQIYAFRGAINALDVLKYDVGAEPLYLTHSFRFANDTPMVKKANCILRNWKNETKKMVGAGEPNEKLPDAIISRTNSAIVARLLNLSDDEKKGIAVFGNVKDIITNIALIADVIRGYKDENAGDIYKHDYEVLKREVSDKRSDEHNLNYIRKKLVGGKLNLKGESVDYAVACTILKKHGDHILNEERPSEHIKELLRGVSFGKTTKDTKRVILTAHASKGLEFYDVELIGFKATFFILMLKIYERLFKERVEKAVKAMRDMEGEVYADEIVDRLPSFEKVWEYILANSNEWAQVINEANLSYVAVTRASNSVRVVDKTPFFGGDAEYEWRKFLRWRINEIIDSKT